MRRREGWEKRLDDVLNEWQGRPFSWGDADCGGFVAAVGVALVGVDYLEAWRGRYDSRQSFLRVMAEEGFGNLAEWATMLLGEPVSPKLARRGDWVITRDLAAGGALGVCIGERAAFLTESAGFTFARTIDCGAAWRVGD